MQATLATNAHKLVYSLDGEEPIAGDAVDVLLEAMLRVVPGPREECERLGGGWRCEGLKAARADGKQAAKYLARSALAM